MDGELNTIVQPLVQFGVAWRGVAGLMGLLWVWERAHSRKREAQLTEAHTRLVEQGRELIVLVKLVRQNTKALVAAERMQKRMCELLEGINAEMRERRSAA
jgi:hypothetical protein